MYRFWVNGSVIYTKIGRIGAPEYCIREWLNEAGIFLRGWCTLTIYSSATGFSDVYLQSSILQKLYNEGANGFWPCWGMPGGPKKVNPMEAQCRSAKQHARSSNCFVKHTENPVPE
ncbi:hypothetical protein ABIB68_004291 [Bradyrhizobium sp. F1.2.2]